MKYDSKQNNEELIKRVMGRIKRENEISLQYLKLSGPC